MKITKSISIFIICIVILSFSKIYAQEFGNENIKSSRNHTIFLGYGLYLFSDFGTGGAVGYSYTIPKTKRIDLEGALYLSNQKFKRTSDMFARDGGKITSFNALFGVRYNLVKREDKAKVFTNFLLGYNYTEDFEYYADNVFNKDYLHLLGCSIGIYSIFKNGINIGIGVESYPSLFLKLGYTF